MFRGVIGADLRRAFSRQPASDRVWLRYVINPLVSTFPKSREAWCVTYRIRGKFSRSVVAAACEGFTSPRIVQHRLRSGS